MVRRIVRSSHAQHVVSVSCTSVELRYSLVMKKMQKQVTMFRSKVMDTKEEMHHEAGTIVPIGRLESIRRGEVSVEGRVIELWEPSSTSIQQVGLLEDETGRTKFTIWAKSRQTMVKESELVRFRAAAKNWYNGRCSIALTRWSEIVFPERGQWWE